MMAKPDENSRIKLSNDSVFNTCYLILKENRYPKAVWINISMWQMTLYKNDYIKLSKWPYVTHDSKIALCNFIVKSAELTVLNRPN